MAVGRTATAVCGALQAWGNALLKPLAAVDRVAPGVFPQNVVLIPREGRFLIEEMCAVCSPRALIYVSCYRNTYS